MRKVIKKHFENRYRFIGIRCDIWPSTPFNADYDIIDFALLIKTDFQVDGF